jgi:hypothetical protein
MEDPEFVLRPLLAGHPDGVRDTLLATCAVVRKAAPGVTELIFLSYVVGDVFTFTGGSGTGFIHVVAYANHVNLGFFLGAELDDPKALLEGSGKKIRHIRIEASADLRRKPVRDLIDLAVEQGIAMAEMRDGIQPRSVKVSAKARLATRAQKKKTQQKKTQQKSEKKTKTAAAKKPQKKVAKRATKKVAKKARKKR